MTSVVFVNCQWIQGICGAEFGSHSNKFECNEDGAEFRMIFIACEGDQLSVYSVLLNIIFGCEFRDAVWRSECLLPRDNNRMVVVEDEILQCESSHDV